MATLKTWERRYLCIFASQKRSLAKMQRVDEHASLIYKTAFLLKQKMGPKTTKITIRGWVVTAETTSASGLSLRLRKHVRKLCRC